MYYIKKINPYLWTVGMDTDFGWASAKNYSNPQDAQDHADRLNASPQPPRNDKARRDMFAAAALQGIIAASGDLSYVNPILVEYAQKYADKMIEQLNKTS